MACTSEFVRRTGRFRAPLFAVLILVLASCNSTDAFNPEGTVDPATVDDLGGAGAVPVEEPSFATSYAGGIPMGLFQTPYGSIGSTYNGTLRNIYPNNLVDELRAIKSRGGKVVLNLAGAPSRYKVNGYFSLSKWKASVDRFKNTNFSAFITDGTIIGNFLIDEPNSKKRWGKPISASTIEEMARYSKMRWSGMATLARVRPDYLNNSHRYLDGAWSQYHSRFGDPGKYIAHDIAVAKNKGLALVTGMNVLKGNGGSKMSASQVKSWGGALLNNSYVCAFVSWTYNSNYLSTRAMKDAMKSLRNKAQNRSFKKCR